MAGAFEGSHMSHPDFRAHRRIFATLNAEETLGVVMITPEQQQRFLAEHPEMFSPAPGAWGRSGSTRVHLDVADEDTVGEAVTLAWQYAAARANKPAAKKRASTPSRTAATQKRVVAKKKAAAAKKTTRRR
jgi:YjbR